MSIEVYLSSIESSRNEIRTKLVSMGLADSGDQLDRLAEVIAALVDQGAVKVSVKEGETYTIPAGFHNGSGTVTGVAGGGSYNLQAKTVTPTKAQQSVVPDEGYFGLSAVTVNAIPGVYQDTSKVTAEAGDVLSGKIIVLANGTVTTGTMPDNGTVSKKLDATTVSYTIPKGKHSGSGTVQIVLEEKSVTPTKSAQTITPTSGKVLSKVFVAAIPSPYHDVSQVDAEPSDVIEGKTIVKYSGEVVNGTMPNVGQMDGTIDGLTKTSYTIPEGFHNGEGKVTLTDDIEIRLSKI